MTPIAFTALALLFPGMVAVISRRLLPSYTIAEKLPVAVAISLSYWIIGFWMLSIFPIPHTWFIYGSLMVSTAAFCICAVRKKPSRLPASLRHLLPVVLLALLAVPFILTAFRSIAPPGADMSMHAYLSEIIFRNNAFPATMRPIIPLDEIGRYPIGFPAIIATLMHLNGLPVYTNAWILTAAIYMLFSASVYTLLRRTYPIIPSVAGALAVSFISRTPYDFIEWGANPTILSLTFLIFCLVFLSRNGPRSYALAALFFAATFYTHSIITASALYMAVPLLLVATSGKSRPDARSIAAFFPVLAAGILPFIIRFGSNAFDVQEAGLRFVSGLHREEFSMWPGTLATVLPSLFQFVSDHMGRDILILYGSALAILILARHKDVRLHILGISIIILLVLNSRFWILPLSPLLYPKRVILLLTIPIGLSVAGAYTWLYDHVCLGLVHATRDRQRILACVLLLLLGYWYAPVMYRNLRWLLSTPDQSVLTKEDVAAMRWLSQHITPDAIIWNNTEDAGKWIPAVAGRPITSYHTNPFDIGKQTTSTESATYAYVGSKTLTNTPDTDPVTEAIRTAPDLFTRVYVNGGAAVYKIIR